MPATAPSRPPTQIGSREFRRACGQFATGVTVVTVRDGDGARGMTANSFTSVSLDPPLVLVSIDCRNRTHDLLEPDARFAISVLAAEHRPWSDRFAGRHGDVQDRFDDVPHRLTEDGLPVVEGAAASFVCRVVAVHPAGDHCLFVGEVQAFEASAGASPLLFYGGGYRALDEDEDEAVARSA